MKRLFVLMAIGFATATQAQTEVKVPSNTDGRVIRLNCNANAAKANIQSVLVVVDGVEMNSDYLKQVNPNDIESVYVLKDEKALKQYGEKGRNGVIIVKTKCAQPKISA